MFDPKEGQAETANQDAIAPASEQATEAAPATGQEAQGEAATEG